MHGWWLGLAQPGAKTRPLASSKLGVVRRRSAAHIASEREGRPVELEDAREPDNRKHRS